MQGSNLIFWVWGEGGGGGGEGGEKKELPKKDEYDNIFYYIPNTSTIN